MKKYVESWLRAIVADEIAKINTSLARERSMIEEHSAALQGQLEALDKAVQHLNEVKENSALRAHISQLHGHLAEVEATFRKLHPQEGLPQ